MIISLAEPIRVLRMPGTDRSGDFGAFVGGLHTSPATVAHDGRQFGIHVELSPLGARRLFGLPAGELAGRVLHLSDLLGAGAAELTERLAEATGWKARFAVLDDVLGRAARDTAARDTAAPAPEVVRVWQRLLDSGGTVAVEALANEVGWSRRHLGQRFRAELGLTPKAAARVTRFDRAHAMLGHRPLAEVAAVCGYYDQAHLTREYRDLAGQSPAALLAAEFPFVQDTVAAAGAR